MEEDIVAVRIAGRNDFMAIRKYIQRKIARSGSSICPICEMRKLLVIHHIRGREVSDWNRWYNEVWLCAACHDECHSSPPLIIIEGWLQTTLGKKLIWRRSGEAPVANPGATPHLYGAKSSISSVSEPDSCNV